MEVISRILLQSMEHLEQAAQRIRQDNDGHIPDGRMPVAIFGSSVDQQTGINLSTMTCGNIILLQMNGHGFQVPIIIMIPAMQDRFVQKTLLIFLQHVRNPGLAGVMHAEISGCMAE